MCILTQKITMPPLKMLKDSLCRLRLCRLIKRFPIFISKQGEKCSMNIVHMHFNLEKIYGAKLNVKVRLFGLIKRFAIFISDRLLPLIAAPNCHRPLDLSTLDPVAKCIYIHIDIYTERPYKCIYCMLTLHI